MHASVYTDKHVDEQPRCIFGITRHGVFCSRRLTAGVLFSHYEFTYFQVLRGYSTGQQSPSSLPPLCRFIGFCLMRAL